MIQFKFRRLEIPPNYNVNHLGKIRFLEVMGHFVFASLVLCNILIKLLVEMTLAKSKVREKFHL